MIDPLGFPEGLSALESIEWVIKNNQVAQGMLVAGPTTALIYALKNVPAQIFRFIRQTVSYTLTFRSDTSDYYFANKYIYQNIVLDKLSHKFAYDRETIWNEDQETTTRGLSLGYGNHWGWYQGAVVKIKRELIEENHGNEFKELLTLTFYGLSAKRIEKLNAEILTAMDNKGKSNLVHLRFSSGGGWRAANPLTKRSIHSVFVPEGPELVQKIKHFDSLKDEYALKGIPHHMGILLTGEPGTGKTSLIHALASETDREIVFLNLSAITTDTELVTLMTHYMDWHKLILVLEDIDVSRVATNRDEESKTVTLSSLLNILDGILTPRGMITIATTNRPESLDKALVRPGRFDYLIEIKRLQWGQFRAMAGLLRDDAEKFDELEPIYVPTLGAECREWLLHESFESIKNKFL